METKFDVTNLTEVYKHYNAKVLEMIRSKAKYQLRREENVEDINAEVWIKIQRYLPSFNPAKGAFNTFIFGIVISVVIDYYRKHKNVITSEKNVGGFVDENGDNFDFDFVDETTPNKVLENAELSAQLGRAFEALKPNYRRVAELFFCEQKQYTEIAEIMDMPLNSVKVTLMRAKEMLQSELSKIAMFA